jgi:lipopolysaccharide/colanic/teichoic acid biosynthesis glycosyltransferase
VATRMNTSVFGPTAGTLSRSRAAAHRALAGNLVLLRGTLHPLTATQQMVKRVLDLAGSLVLLVLTAPLLLLAALLIRLTSRGPALYSQIRVGLHGREFRVFKLRTMIDGAEARTGPVMATAGDPRITAIGRILRATRVDELPQLFNVLLGQMSLIGPRPERPYFVSLFLRHLPGYGFRFAVKPGITGLAQAFCRYSTAPALKLRFDLHYIDNYSLLLEARIVFRTLLTILQPSRARGVARRAPPANRDPA